MAKTCGHRKTGHHGKSKGGRNKTELRVRYLWRGNAYVKVHALTSVYAGTAPTSNALEETQAEIAGSVVTGAPLPDAPALGGDSGNPPFPAPFPAAGAPPSLPIAEIRRGRVLPTATAHGVTWAPKKSNSRLGALCPSRPGQFEPLRVK